MKLRKKITSFLMAVFMANPALSFAGADGSGGGNTERSTEAEVEFQTSGAASNVVDYLSDARGFNDPKADQIAARIRGIVKMDRVNDGTGYQLVRGACLLDGAERHSGSAVIGDPEQPFCLSLTELQKLPPKVLLEQIIGLMAHELAHQAGYGEAEANHLQVKVLQRARNAALGYTFRSFVTRAQVVAGEARRALLEGGSNSRVCAELGKLDAHIEAIGAFAGQYTYDDANPETYLEIQAQAEAAGRLKFSSGCSQSGVQDPERLRESLMEVEVRLLQLERLWPR